MCHWKFYIGHLGSFDSTLMYNKFSKFLEIDGFIVSVANFLKPS